jgi:prepilin-type N-terminal cleavage/methylation domain-containing protein
MNHSLSKLKAFSLIELSIVILIIGILVAGVTSSSRLIARMKVITAQNLTRNSPISSIKDLSFWYETSLDKSFNDTEETDNSFVTSWYDNNQTSLTKFNMTSPASTNNQPKYIESAVNGLPAIRFDGDDYFNFDSSQIVNTSFTMFVVDRKIGLGANYLISWNTTASCNVSECFHTGYGSDNQFHIGFWGNDTAYPSNSLMGQKNRMHCIMLDRSFGKRYWLDGGSTPDVTQNNPTPILANKASALGYGVNSYNGYIAEFIVFSRALKDEERQSIDSYLSKKYSIPIN